jgi:hypothetical protein
MSLAGAVTYLTVTKVWPEAFASSHGLGSSVGQIPLSDLPALVLEFDPAGGEGFAVTNADVSEGAAVLYMRHSIVVQAVALGATGAAQDSIPALVDAYLASILDDVTLDDNLSVPLRIFGIDVRVDDTYGMVLRIEFRHRWELTIT